jgi:hypothetical protein
MLRDDHVSVQASHHRKTGGQQGSKGGRRSAPCAKTDPAIAQGQYVCRDAVCALGAHLCGLSERVWILAWRRWACRMGDSASPAPMPLSAGVAGVRLHEMTRKGLAVVDDLVDASASALPTIVILREA